MRLDHINFLKLRFSAHNTSDNYTRLYLVLISLYALILPTFAQGQAQISYNNASLKIKGNKGSHINIANTYTLDAATFLPTFDTGIATIGDEPFHITPHLSFGNLQTEFSGTFRPKWGYQFHLNFANGKIQMLNMLFDYRLSNNLKLSLGQMKVPGPMSKNHSTKSAMAMDTPMGLTLASSRRFGVGLFHTSDRHYLAIGAYTINLNNYIGTGLPRQPEIGVATRFTYNVINKKSHKLLLGGNIYWMRMPNGEADKSGTIGVETKATFTRFITYNLAHTQSQLNYGLELAYQKDRFLLTAEGLGSNFFRGSETPTPQYVGWAMRASYMLLGASRKYQVSSADFAGSPYGEKGALEVGLRTSGIYFNDQVEDGRIAGSSYGLFLNYWTTDHLCFSIHTNYLNHHKKDHGSYTINYPEHFKGINFIVFQGRITILF